MDNLLKVHKLLAVRPEEVIGRRQIKSEPER
jgi:hypothetical protein